MDLSSLQKVFPKKDPNATAVTGYIPMDYFEKFETCIRKVCKEAGLKPVWRGPREKYASSTLRRNAHSVVLYYK